MVTRSKKPEADAAPKKASRPKAAAKPKAAATKTGVKKTATKKTVVKAAPKKAAPKKAAPKAAAKKTIEVVKIPEVGRKIGDMVYNDELLESLAEIILLGKYGASESVLPEVKKQLFDYDIYKVSFLTDDEIGEIAKAVKASGNGDVPEKGLKEMLLSVRDSAKAFVELAVQHNSVRAFIDRMLVAEGSVAGLEMARDAFRNEPECCERFLLFF
jgi:hypothetical protein